MFTVQKSSLSKRIAAFLLDLILLTILAVGFAFLVSLVCNYDHYVDLSTEYYEEYSNYEATYGESLSASFGLPFDEALEHLLKSDYASLSVADAAAFDAYHALTPVDEVNYCYTMIYQLMMLMTTVGILFAYITLEFIVPLFFKNGQTIGKKIFGICLVRPDCVKINVMSLFVRTFLGKYTIGTMVPVFIVYLIIFAGIGPVGAFVLIGLLLLEIGLLLFTKNKTMIHDLMSGTVVVDYSTQSIFETEEAMIETKKRIHADKVENTPA